MVSGYPRAPATGYRVIKANWSPKRDAKLMKLYREIVADGKITPKEAKKVLKKMGYEVSKEEALQFLFTLDVNRDGIISCEEFMAGVHAFSCNYPKTPKAYRKKSKKDKKKYKY